MYILTLSLGEIKPTVMASYQTRLATLPLEGPTVHGIP